MQTTFESGPAHSNTTLWSAQVNESTEGEEHCGPARPERICSSGGGRVMAELIRLYLLVWSVETFIHIKFIFTLIFSLVHISQFVVSLLVSI